MHMPIHFCNHARLVELSKGYLPGPSTKKYKTATHQSVSSEVRMTPLLVLCMAVHFYALVWLTVFILFPALEITAILYSNAG